MKYLNLAPCPRCKNKTPTVNAIIMSGKAHYVITCGCGMQSPIKKTKVEVVNWWNKIERREVW